MDDGIEEEVVLCCPPEGEATLELHCRDQVSRLPILRSQVDELLRGGEVRLEAPDCTCSLIPAGGQLAIDLRGCRDVRFVIGLHHFAVLARSIGLGIP
jgi:hypothetical protein